MIIRLHEIPEKGLALEDEEPAEILELENASEVANAGPVHYDLFLQIVSGELIVKGEVSAELELVCSRCGGFFSTNCGNSAFLRAYSLEPGSDMVDLTDDLREAVLLGMPTFAVCSEDCEGRCPHCGIDLNKESCECEPPTGDIRWGALDELDL